MDPILTQEIVNLGTELAKLVVKGTASAVTTRIKAIQSEKEIMKIRSVYDEIISELLEERSQALRIAQTYQSELERLEISDKDIEYLHNTISRLLEIMRKVSLVPKLDNESEDADSGSDIYEQAKELISIDTIKAMQLIGFNYRKAIGEPLTDLCANSIARFLGKGNTTSNGKNHR